MRGGRLATLWRIRFPCALPSLFAAILVLAAMGVALFWLIAVLERLAIPWHASQKEPVSSH
jgi:ABC-type nitrate/sulfonate/bicarbonate transport system permease component